MGNIKNSVLLRTFLDNLPKGHDCKFDLEKFRAYAKITNGKKCRELTIKDVIEANSWIRLNDKKQPIGKEWIPMVDLGSKKKGEKHGL